MGVGQAGLNRLRGMDGRFSIDYSSSRDRDCGKSTSRLRQERCASRARNHEKVQFDLETPPFPVGRRLMARIAPLLVGWRPYALLVTLCLAFYLPGMNAIPVLDRDEARFAQATRQMLQTGDFLHIRFQNEARNQKPAGVYWLQAASVSAFSDPESTAIWPYRLPSLIGASLSVLLSFGLGRALLREAPGAEAAAPRTALIAAVLLAASLGVMAEAHIAKTDAALLAAIVVGQGALGLAYIRARRGRPVGINIAIVFWLAEIAAILLKGPVGPALALATAAALSIADRDAAWLRTLRPLAGIVGTGLAIAPWLYAIEQATEGRFLADSLGHDFLAKLLGGQESHGAPPFYYLTLAMITFWPGSLYLAPTLMRGWQRHEQPLVRFLLAWIVPAWVMMELIPTKLPHYVLPLYPALALLTAGVVAEGIDHAERAWARWTRRAVEAIWVVVTVVIIGGAVIVLPIRFGAGPDIVGPTAVIVLVVLMAILLWRRPGPAASAATIAALSLTLTISVGIWILPSLDRLWLSRDAALLIARDPPPPGTPLVTLGYAEPSLVFLLGGKLRITIVTNAVAELASGGRALVSGREDAQFLQGLAARGLEATPLGNIHGTNYSNGQRMVLTLYRVRPK
jgi:4-amino-4-deoxy-L-arabinose transferase-like glycosyltransferase